MKIDGIKLFKSEIPYLRGKIKGKNEEKLKQPNLGGRGNHKLSDISIAAPLFGLVKQMVGFRDELFHLIP